MSGNPYGRLAGMSAAFATSNLARTAIAFATSLVVARGLGVADFGRWTLCTAWASLLTAFVDLGFGVLLTRDAARDLGAAARAVPVAFLARFAALAPGALLLLAAPAAVAPDAQTADALRIAPAIAAAGVAYGCLAPVFRASPGALVAALAIETAGAVGQWGGAWWLVRSGGTVVELLTLAALVQAGQFLAAAALWAHLVRPVAAVRRPSLATIRAVLREALPFAAAGVIANAQLRLAPVLLGLFGGPAGLAAFGAAARLGGVARMLPQAAFAGALPVLSHEASRGGSDAVRARFERTLLVFSLAAAAILVAFARPAITWTFGPGFADAVTPLVWIGIGLAPALVNSGRNVYLNATGRETVAVGWSAAALALQAVAAVALIPAFGAAGAAAGLAAGDAAVWWPLRKAGVKPLERLGSPVGVVGDGPPPG